MVSEFWALDGVSFDAFPGDVMGIIGRNGAGKSTLLKIISRVTSPTSGKVMIAGRVGSLLEVGSGFNAELTGRENIYISGAIIGMTRSEIRRKFEAIVDFSGVEKFLDTPVKRYSSGMEVRLAFSVAAHLHPDLLLVDEVLSIGDADFQEKSLRKIRQVAEDGGTVVFISHNMSAVSSFCNKVMVLDHGRIVYPAGNVSAGIEMHHRMLRHGLGKVSGWLNRPDNSVVRLVDFSLKDGLDNPIEQVTTGMPIRFGIRYETSSQIDLDTTYCAIMITSANGELISYLRSDSPIGQTNSGKNQGELTCAIEKIPLAPGHIRVSVLLEREDLVLDQLTDCYVGNVDSGGRTSDINQHGKVGLVVLDEKWSGN